MGILLGVLTFILILVSLFLILVVLAQKSSDAGLGAAIGGGAAEAAFGAQTNSVLTKATIYSSILFFVLSLLLYLGRIYQRAHANEAARNALPTIAAPVAPLTVPATKTAPAGAMQNPAPATTTAPVLPAPGAATPSTTPTGSVPATH